MRVRADLAEEAFVAPRDHVWVSSPTPGVERMMLDRWGAEEAVATSFVRFAPGARFPHHHHPLGEEFIVLEGDFHDAAGGYPAGSYLRHPPGSSHAPWSELGCLLFVKLRQFAREDAATVEVDLTRLPTLAAGESTGRYCLHRFADEQVWIVDARAGALERFEATRCVREVLILSGRVEARGRVLEARSWLRMPGGGPFGVRFIEDSRVFVKTRPSQSVQLAKPTAM